MTLGGQSTVNIGIIIRHYNNYKQKICSLLCINYYACVDVAVMLLYFLLFSHLDDSLQEKRDCFTLFCPLFLRFTFEE